MDEEQQQPKKKIDIDSFFNRVDAVEGLASSALKQTNLNANAIQANKTLINSISVTIESMKTEIRDIANYIVIENKLEKDKKEDEKFEAEDKEQKEKLEDRLKAAQGVIQPKDIKPGAEKDEGGKKTGGGFLGGLFKVVAGLGLAAGLIALAPYIVPALIAGAGALLITFIASKIIPPIVKLIKKFIQEPMKYIAIAIRNTLGRIPLIKGPALAWADSIESGAEKISGKLDADAITSKIKSGGGGGNSSNLTPEGGGGGNTGKVSDSNVDLTDKNIAEGAENINDSVNENDNKKMKVTRETRNMTPEDIKKKIVDVKAEIKEMEESGVNERKIMFKEKELGILEDTLTNMRKASGNLTDIEKTIRDSGHFQGETKFSATETIIQAETGDSFSNRLDLNEGVQTTQTSNVTGVDFENTATTVISTDFNKNTNLGNIDPKLKKVLLKAIQ